MTTLLWIAFFVWLVRKFWKWVQLRCDQIDYENSFIADLRRDIKEGKIKWPR